MIFTVPGAGSASLPMGRSQYNPRSMRPSLLVVDRGRATAGARHHDRHPHGCGFIAHRTCRRAGNAGADVSVDGGIAGLAPHLGSSKAA